MKIKAKMVVFDGENIGKEIQTPAPVSKERQKELDKILIVTELTGKKCL